MARDLQLNRHVRMRRVEGGECTRNILLAEVPMGSLGACDEISVDTQLMHTRPLAGQ